jgi:hypothetical protein
MRAYKHTSTSVQTHTEATPSIEGIFSLRCEGALLLNDNTTVYGCIEIPAITIPFFGRLSPQEKRKE